MIQQQASHTHASAQHHCSSGTFITPYETRIPLSPKHAVHALLLICMAKFSPSFLSHLPTWLNPDFNPQEPGWSHCHFDYTTLYPVSA